VGAIVTGAVNETAAATALDQHASQWRDVFKPRFASYQLRLQAKHIVMINL
jgi:hypothetical protein